MVAFLYLAAVASLAFPTLISAAPQPILAETELVVRDGGSYLTGLYNNLQGPCDAISMLFHI